MVVILQGIVRVGRRSGFFLAKSGSLNKVAAFAFTPGNYAPRSIDGHENRGIQQRMTKRGEGTVRRGLLAGPAVPGPRLGQLGQGT